MPVTLITGPHQSGKSRRLWERLRAEPPGSAVLVRPTAGLPHDLIRQVHAWSGPGLLPPVWSFAELVERTAAVSADTPRPFANGLAVHVLRTWATTNLRGPWARLARFRATGRELAELCRRLDDYGVTGADLDLVAHTLRGRGDGDLAAALADARAAAAHLDRVAAKRGAALAGARLRRLAASDAAPAVASFYIDDFQTFAPAELALLRALGEQRTLVIAAVDDRRLGADASPADRLRAALPGADEERLGAFAAQAPHAPSLRTFLTDALEEGRRLPSSAVGHYRYRDPLHAGRAIAAWLRRSATAPGDALLVVRVADAEALALADALSAAEVPVSGRFQVPLLGTAVGGALAALTAFCREPTWGAFLDLIERIAGDDQPPVRLADLVGPWARLTVDEGIARLSVLVSNGETPDRWGWTEPDRKRPWLASATQWLAPWHDRLRADGTWWQRLHVLATRLDLDDGGSGVLRTLAELAALHPVSGEDCDELLGAARVDVVRDGGPGALEITDAVRGRSWPRPVVLIHDLEHGRWPGQQTGGALLPLDERRLLAALLGRDVYDEIGRSAGEIASFLAVAGRATSRVVLGIPCGEREPCAWLGTLCDQLGWDLDGLRKDAGGEAVPGAPLGLHDAQGAHERALWSVAPGVPRFTFRVPPAAPSTLGLRASSLGVLFRDSFSVVCDRLGLGEPLANQELMAEGSDLHQVLKELAAHPPAIWATVLPPLLTTWTAEAPDALACAERGRLSRRVVAVMADEAQAAAGTRSREPELKADVPLTIPGHETLILHGRIDRLDRLEDGSVRLVDYKRGAIGALATALSKGIDGQLLAYLLAAHAAGWQAESAYYLSLRSGARAGWGTIPTPGGRSPTKAGVDLATLVDAATALGQVIAELSAGTAHADPDGRSAADYAPIARLDEVRLDLSGGGDDA